MSDSTTIEWTDATFNPWWGCTKVSPGCDHCYAERDANRFAPGLWGPDAKRRTFGDKHWDEPVKWNERARRAGKRMRVFCASMADVFDKDAPAGERDRLFALIEATPHLDWQLLTKRVGNVAKMVPFSWMSGHWPANAWIGASVVNREEMLRDGRKLKELPAAVRFWSVEPMLAPLGHIPRELVPEWVIAGGESGPHARPMHPEWALSLRDQCAAAGVPFLFKQWGEYVPMMGHTEGVPVRGAKFTHPDGTIMGFAGKKVAGRMLDGRTWDEYPSPDAAATPQGATVADAAAAQNAPASPPEVQPDGGSDE